LSDRLTRLGSKDAEFGQHYTITSSFLVSAVGQLNVPQYPSIPNISTFQGKSMHSARWDWDYDVRGKKVGIIGNGATAAQIIPEVARVCESLTVFQRTPNWVVPRDDRPISSTMQKVYKYVPFVRRRYRAQLMDWREEFFHVVFDRESEIHRVIKEGAQEHMVRQLPGEGYARLREKLEPQYDVGCKRVIVSDDFYPTFTRENVLLETTAIKLITEKGIEVEGGEEHEFDLLIYATGFKTTQFMYPIKIYGTDGQSLEKIWASGASAYLGITVPSLPNFSMLYGNLQDKSSAGIKADFVRRPKY
jgi:cation diffusion facilitator CzcD-associated flavoprotein CzcO